MQLLLIRGFGAELLTFSHIVLSAFLVFFFFQAEDGIRDDLVTGVQTCALPISPPIDHAGACTRHRRDTPAAAPHHAAATPNCPDARSSASRSARHPDTDAGVLGW